jgi:hypothetical protein
MLRRTLKSSRDALRKSQGGSNGGDPANYMTIHFAAKEGRLDKVMDLSIMYSLL